MRGNFMYFSDYQFIPSCASVCHRFSLPVIMNPNLEENVEELEKVLVETGKDEDEGKLKNKTYVLELEEAIRAKEKAVKDIAVKEVKEARAILGEKMELLKKIETERYCNQRH